MESLRNEPVILSGLGNMGGGPGYGYGSGLGLEALLLASLFGGRFGHGYGHGDYHEAKVDLGTFLNQQSISDTRRDIKDSESEIRESIHNSDRANTAEFRAVGIKLCDIEKEVALQGCETRHAIKDTECNLTNVIKDDGGRTRDQLRSFETSVDKQFCNLTHYIDKKFDHVDRRFEKLEKDQLLSRIEELKDRNSSLVTINNTNQQTQSITAAVAQLLKTCGNPCANV